MVAVDAHDLAFGTSRWSSKLVHGGLRYLAKGQLGVAHESAVERGILMEMDCRLKDCKSSKDTPILS